MYSEDYDDSFRNNSQNQGSGPRRSNGLSTASLVLGIIALLSSSILYIAVPCGALAILFALLSRGNGKMAGKCKTGIVMGIIGALSSIIMTVGAFYLLLTNSDMQRDFEYMFNLYAHQLGLDYDFDDVKEMFGLDQDEDKDEDEDDAVPDENDYYNQYWSDFYSNEQDDKANDYWREFYGNQQQPEDSVPDPLPAQDSIPAGGEFI